MTRSSCIGMGGLEWFSAGLRPPVPPPCSYHWPPKALSLETTVGDEKFASPRV